MSTITTRPLGRTDLNVTRLGYGAMEIRGPRIWSGREVSDAQAQRILSAVLTAASPLLIQLTTTVGARPTLVSS